MVGNGISEPSTVGPYFLGWVAPFDPHPQGDWLVLKFASTELKDRLSRQFQAWLVAALRFAEFVCSFKLIKQILDKEMALTRNDCKRCSL